MKGDRFDAVILAGGSGRRLGGVDKAAVRVGEKTLFERTLTAVEGAARIVCVGPGRATSVPIEWTTEQPPGGGPAAGLGAGMRLVDATRVVVLAVDVPFVTRDVVTRLVDGCAAQDAAMVVDPGGRPQPLIAAYRTDALRARLRGAGNLSGASIHTVIEGMSCTLVDAPEVTLDVDTDADLERARLRIRDG